MPERVLMNRNANKMLTEKKVRRHDGGHITIYHTHIKLSI